MTKLANVDAAQRAEWLVLYERMLLIRRAEERFAKEAQAGTLPKEGRLPLRGNRDILHDRELCGLEGT